MPRLSESLSPCKQCPSGRVVLESPQKTHIMFLSESPGPDEDRKLYPFAGRSGREYGNLYLPLSGLDRYEVYTSNLTKCFQKYKGKDNGKGLSISCSNHWLPWELRRVKPEIIVTMGSPALRLFMPNGLLESEHGIPFPGKLTRTLPSGELDTYWEGTVFPTFNPAAGMRSGDFMRMAMEDFRALRRHLSGEDVVPHDAYPNPRFKLISGREEVTDTLEWSWALSSYNTGEGERPVIAIDTETTPAEEEGAPDNPFCLTLSLSPDEAFLIMADDSRGLTSLVKWIDRTGALVILHNLLFDVKVMGDMAVIVPLNGDLTQRASHYALDTMVMLYNQCNLPKGLKIASRRLLGVRMKDFDDVVTPHSLKRVVEYLQAVVDCGLYVNKGKKVIKRVWLSDWEEYRLPRQVGLDKRAQRMLDDARRMVGGELLEDEEDGEERVAFPPGTQPEEDEEYTTNIWARWKKLPANLREPAERLLGPLPKKSIAHVPMSEVIDYACRDANVTLRLYQEVLLNKLASWRPS